MAAAGHTVADICEVFDVSRNAITGICKDYGISLSRVGRPRIKTAPIQPVQVPPQPAAPQPQHPPRMAELIATGGRYADLRAWAERWGVTETKARQEWHRLRLPVRRGGVA